jgi:hypothetical protein
MYTMKFVGLRAPVVAAGLWLFSACAVADDAIVADDPLNYSGPARKQDEVFVVSSRALGAPTGELPPALAVSRFNERDAWEPLSLETLLQEKSAGTTTLIYVHGYDFDEEKAERVGWAFYHEFCDELPAEERVRFVIWSWPTVAKKFRPVRDFIDKTNRSDADAYYLAWFIAQLPPDTHVGLTGSALGCQVVQGTLHLLGGGSLGDWKLPTSAERQLPAMTTVFIAPAVNNDWLYPGGFHERAVAGTSRLLLVNNPTDAALCRYGQPWKSKPVALGQSGLTDLQKLGEFANRIEQLDASEQIGEEHGVEHYLRQPELVARMRKTLVGR